MEFTAGTKDLLPELAYKYRAWNCFVKKICPKFKLAHWITQLVIQLLCGFTAI